MSWVVGSWQTPHKHTCLLLACRELVTTTPILLGDLMKIEKSENGKNCYFKLQYNYVPWETLVADDTFDPGVMALKDSALSFLWVWGRDITHQSHYWTTFPFWQHSLTLGLFRPRASSFRLMPPKRDLEKAVIVWRAQIKTTVTDDEHTLIPPAPRTTRGESTAATWRGSQSRRRKRPASNLIN